MACMVSGVGIKPDMFSGMSDEECIRRGFGDSADAILRELETTRIDMTLAEFAQHCAVLDGKLGEFFMSGLLEIAPNLHAIIPDIGNDIVRFVALCRVLKIILKSGDEKMKTNEEWTREAVGFLHEWGSTPTRDDVVSVCMDLATDPEVKSKMIASSGTVGVYADTLWRFILKLSI